MLQKIGTAVAWLTRMVGRCSFVLVTVMMLLNVADVLLTKLMQSPITGSYELTQRLLMCAVFTAFAHAQTRKSHINMTILIGHFPRVPRFISCALTSLASVVAAVALTWAAAVQGNVALQNHYATEVLYIPLYPFYYIEAAAMGVFALALAYDALLAILAVFSKRYAALLEE